MRPTTIIPFVNGTDLRRRLVHQGREGEVDDRTPPTTSVASRAGTADAIAFLDARIDDQAITYTCN